MHQIIGAIVRWVVRRLVRIYYPKIEVTGRDLIPRHGPVLLVANHANSLIDPVIVGITAKQPVRFFAKAPLFDMPVIGALMRGLGMLPAYRAQDDGAQVRRNLESLNVGAQALAAGQVVGIFPEGKSHDTLTLEQIRSGASRMAVQAVEQGASALKIVPIGINYQRKQLFRSAIWVRVGRPIDVRRFIARHGDAKRATRALTGEIEARLKRVVLHLRDQAHEPFLDELEVLLPPPKRLRGHQAISALRQRKRLADAMNHFVERGPTRALEMSQAIADYRMELGAAGLSSRSPVMRMRRLRLFTALAVHALWLAFWSPTAFVGTAFHLVPFFCVRALARRFNDGPTTTALARLAIGLPLYGLWYAGAWWALRSYFLPWVAWTFVGLMPLAGTLALTYFYRAREVWTNWLRQMRVLIRPGQLQELREHQRVLRERLQQFVSEFSTAFPSLEEQPRRFSRREQMKFALRWAAIVLVAAGIFVWQNFAFNERRQRDRMHGLNLAGMTSASLSAALTADETTLRDVLTGVETLERRTRAMMAEFAAGKRSWYRQADNDEARSLLLTYLNYRTALLRIVWKYQDYARVPDDAMRLRAFLATYTAANVLYETSFKFVQLFENAPEAVRKLNEAEPLWNIPEGVYDTVRRSLADSENRTLLRQAHRYYSAQRSGFERHGLLTVAPYSEFHVAIARADGTLEKAAATAAIAGASSPLREAGSAGKEVIYRAQTFVSSWIGDTKLREPHGGRALIRDENLRQLRTKLKPGDVLLQRRNWFLSNAFLPGYWPHAAFYVGTTEELRRMGLDRDPRIARHWQRFVQRDAKGHEYVIIEAIGEGVIFSSLEHSVGEADAAAVLRPRLSEQRIREVIARAFSHVGKPYDFEFDFFSTDKLVCSELVYRALDGDIQLPLVNVMGRKTLPPVEIVRQCWQERTNPPEQFDFVAYLAGDERKGSASFATENDFYQTLSLPGMDLLQPRR